MAYCDLPLGHSDDLALFQRLPRLSAQRHAREDHYPLIYAIDRKPTRRESSLSLLTQKLQVNEPRWLNFPRLSVFPAIAVRE